MESHSSHLAETVARARFSPVRIAAGLDVGPVPPRVYTHEYTSPLLAVTYTVTLSDDGETEAS